MNRWTLERAKAWQASQPWRVGCNFFPSNAINPIEMWQAETWSPEVIDRELGWAADLGFNALRVYLHDLVWSADAVGFLQRIDAFLGIADARGMGVILVFFDDCHRTNPHPGPQPLPVRGVHNSGWSQSPGETIVRAFADGSVSKSERNRLRDYVQSVMRRFADDSRVILWDLYNETGQQGLGDTTLPLLKETWSWAREVPVSQPLSSCLDGAVGDDNIAFSGEMSDIITFHCYDGEKMAATLERLTTQFDGRPVWCSEYMAREHGTTFQHSLPLLKARKAAAINWGLVAGKSQTHFNWQTVGKLEERRAAGDFLNPGDPIPEPDLWFHDIFRPDGSPYDPAETAFIRDITRTF